MIGGQNQQRMAAQCRVVSDGIQDPTEQRVSAFDSRKIRLTHEPPRVSDSIR